MSSDNNVNSYTIENSVHFTYCSEPNMDTLCQGDILEITKEIRTVLEEVHPYFLKEQYKYFMVLTQSCDLVRRDGKNCKTPYITLAAVRNYSDSLERLLVKGRYAEMNNGLLIMDAKNKDRAYQLLERIYNNNEPEYFFLYKEEVFGFDESMVAYLKLSIALKSKDHYEKCLKAKKMELTDEFKAKLGWLVGNMYSRVGTGDWEEIMSPEAKEDMLNNELNSMCVIGEKNQLKQLRTKYLEKMDSKPDHAEAIAFISNIYVKTKYEQVMDVIENVIQTSGKKIPKEEKEKLINSFKSRSALKTLIK